MEVTTKQAQDSIVYIATSLANLANCYSSRGEYGQAVLLHLAMRRRLLPEDHPDCTKVNR
jgi:hypothetical protein